MANANLVANLDRQKIFRALQRARVGLSRLLHHARRRGSVRIDRQAWLDSGEDLTCLFGSGMVRLMSWLRTRMPSAGSFSSTSRRM